jgi:hypothetical protein
MDKPRPGADAIVALRGYTLGAAFLDAWDRRQELADASIAGARDPAARAEELRFSAERVLVACIAQALRRGSKVLILADLAAACAGLGELWPYCHNP